MNRLDMESKNIVNDNISKLKELFPSCVSEGNINFDILKQELSSSLIDDKKEKYELTWPGKKESIVIGNKKTTNTLIPLMEKSVDFDNTKNIYIEGDNLEVLKILQESYLNKIKCIYIDPPYNTGNDFIYNDDFSKSVNEELEESGLIDEYGNRLVTNSSSNGRFHSDWLSMMYPRLKLARNLLTDDGVIFISIDENEIHNMRKICDEIFGETCFVSQLGWQKVYAPKNQARYFSNDYEYILCYAKNIDKVYINELPRTEAMNLRYKNPDNDPRGDWKSGDCVGSGERKNGHYEVVSPTGKKYDVPEGKHWVYAPETMKKMIEDNRIWFGKDGNSFPSVKQFLSEVGGRKASNLLLHEDYGHTDMAKKDLIKLFPDLTRPPFDTPKPVKLIKMLSILGMEKDDIILDFFSGSATTAESIMQLNSEDAGKRKYILVQIQEKINDSEAVSKGFGTLCDIGEERIKRAAKKIKDETNADIDYGFRVYKVDSSNMKEVFYKPSDVGQMDLMEYLSNIKEDRTPEDLLVQVMLDLGLPLDLNIEEKSISNNKVFFVENNSLVACFDNQVDINIVDEICKYNPMKVVFKDISFKTDKDKINLEERIKKISPETEISIL